MVNLKKEYIYFLKNGKIEMVKKPEFGTILLKFQNGEPVLEEVSTQRRII